MLSSSGTLLKKPIEPASHSIDLSSLLLGSIDLLKRHHKDSDRGSHSKHEQTQQQRIQRFHSSTTKRWNETKHDQHNPDCSGHARHAIARIGPAMRKSVRHTAGNGSRSCPPKDSSTVIPSI